MQKGRRKPHRSPQRVMMRRSEARNQAFVREQFDSLKAREDFGNLDSYENEKEVIEEAEYPTNPVNTPDGDLKSGAGAEKSASDNNPHRQIYVLDTNLIISCVDIIYDPDDKNWRPPLDFEPCLDHAHLVIPKVVFDELDHLREHSLNARTALERLTKFFPNSGRKIREIMHLEKPIPTGWHDQVISILPIDRSFVRNLPFNLSETDNDGHIAATALVATLIDEGVIDGLNNVNLLDRSSSNHHVVLLTNDKPLQSKADLFAVCTRGYSFTPRPPFTGFRDLVVPPEMFEQFYHEESLSREDFEYFMPDELPLVANEYIQMTPENDIYPRGYFANNNGWKNLARFNEEHDHLYPLRFVKYEGEIPPNAGIATYYDALNDNRKINTVIVTGRAGVGKSYTAIHHAITAVQRGDYRKALILTTMSAKNPMGALPGGEAEKLEPMVGFVKDAIESYLARTPEFRQKREQLRKYGDRPHDGDDIKSRKKQSARDAVRTSRKSERGNCDFSRLDFEEEDEFTRASDFGEPRNRKKDKAFYPGKSDRKSDNPDENLTYDELLKKQRDYIYNRYFMCVPYEYARGRNFEDCFIIIDEAQRAAIDDIETTATRPGRGSFLVVCGDVTQIEHNSPEKMIKNGLNYARLCCFNKPNCAHIHLTENLRGSISSTFTASREEIRRVIGLS